MYSSSSNCSSCSSIPHMASTFLLFLLLILSLKLFIINALNSIPNLVLGLFFKAPPCVLLCFFKGIKVPLEAFLSAFQGLAYAFNWVFVAIIEIVLGIIGSFLMGVFEFVMNNVVFGSSAIGGLLEKSKISWAAGGPLFEQLREILGSVFGHVFYQLLETATSSAGGILGFAMTGISTLLTEPGSAIAGLVEMLKSSLEEGSSVEGLRGILGSLIENVANTVSEVASSSTDSSFEIVKTIFGVVIDSGFTVGGLMEKTRAAFEVLRMEELRRIIESISKISVNVIISYFLG